MDGLLNDHRINTDLKKNPFNIIQNNVTILLNLWRHNNYIDEELHKVLKCPKDNHSLPRCYGLPKIHKESHPLRCIVSSIDRPTYALSKEINSILSKSIPKPSFFIKDGWQFKMFIYQITIDNDHVLVSLDVKSFYTNIPKELVLKDLKRRRYVRETTGIPLDGFLSAVNLVMDYTSFHFDRRFYSQTFIHLFHPF